MGPIPPLDNHFFIITFQNTFSGYNILVMTPDHMAAMVSCILVVQVIVHPSGY